MTGTALGTDLCPGPVDNLKTTETDTALVLHPDGSGGIEWGVDEGSAFSVISDTITADEDDYEPTGWAAATHIRATLTGGNWSITGAAPATGTDAFVKTIVNISSFAITLTDSDAGSAAANRFLLPGNLDFSIGPNESATIFYDATSTRWRLQ